MELFKDSKNKDKSSKRIARGGSRGTSAGRGTKGQKSRAGHRIRPAGRDFLIRIPKLRGHRNTIKSDKAKVFSLSDLEKFNQEVLTRKELGNVKVLGTGDLEKKINLKGIPVSKSAREKIEKAGGTIS